MKNQRDKRTKPGERFLLTEENNVLLSRGVGIVLSFLFYIPQTQ